MGVEGEGIKRGYSERLHGRGYTEGGTRRGMHGGGHRVQYTRREGSIPSTSTAFRSPQRQILPQAVSSVSQGNATMLASLVGVRALK